MQLNEKSAFNENLSIKKSISDKLSKIDNHNDDKIISNRNIMINNSWFSFSEQSNYLAYNNLKVSSPSKEIKEKQLRVRNIRLNLSSNLKEKVKEAINVTRAIYNKCVDFCCIEKSVSINQTKTKLREELRNLLTYDKETNIFRGKQKEDFEKVPSSIRDEAICDFIKAFDVQLKLQKEDKIKQFDMKHRRKKER